MVVDAEALQGNIIRVDTKNVCELSLKPADRLVDYSKPIRLVWNGNLTTVSNLREKKIVLREENFNPSSSRKTPAISGPIADFQNTPFVIVKGTTSSDPMMKLAIEQKAVMIVSNWKANQKYEPRLMRDIDVTDADLTKYSLMLLGGPKENKIARQIFERIPLKVEDSVVTIGGNHLRQKTPFFTQSIPILIIASGTSPLPPEPQVQDLPSLIHFAAIFLSTISILSTAKSPPSRWAQRTRKS